MSQAMVRFEPSRHSSSPSYVGGATPLDMASVNGELPSSLDTPSRSNQLAPIRSERFQAVSAHRASLANVIVPCVSTPTATRRTVSSAPRKRCSDSRSASSICLRSVTSREAHTMAPNAVASPVAERAMVSSHAYSPVCR